VRVADAVDIVAADVFSRADRAQVPITPAMVERRMAQLAGHRPGCRCRLHVAAAKVRKPLDVYYRAIAWEHAIAATRWRATR
jgi:hypothetical protein